MEQLFTIRRNIIFYYKRYETIINVFLKFLLGLVVLISINSFGYAKMLNNIPLIILASAVIAVAPATWMFVVSWIFIVIQIFYASFELSVIIGLLLLCLLFFYIRIFPVKSYIIIILIICCNLNIPYVVPIFAGLFVGISSVAPIVIGTFLFYLLSSLPTILPADASNSTISLLSLPDSFSQHYIAFMKLITSNQEWVYSALVFTIVILTVYSISRLSIDYSMEFSILAGAIVNMVGFIVVALISEIELSIIWIVFSSIISAALIYICKFFYIIVDYQGAQNVNFQDDDYLYYVRVIPKINNDPVDKQVRKFASMRKSNVSGSKQD